MRRRKERKGKVEEELNNMRAGAEDRGGRRRVYMDERKKAEEDTDGKTS